jgi:tRNA uridine 5-carbamoylmethylation protein Kti12
MDKATQEIFSVLQAALPSAMAGDVVRIPKCSPVMLKRKPTVAELSRLRRQFLKLAKTHPGDDASGAGEMFVKYLNANLS